MIDAIALSDSVVFGGLLAILVFGAIHFVDDVVDLLVSMGDHSAGDRIEEYESPNT